MNLACAVGTRGDCTRRQVGAVVLGADNRVVSVGYNGAPSGLPGCLTASACPRGHFNHEQLPAKAKSEHECIAVHAEANALIYAPRSDVRRGTMYVSYEPCPGCIRLMQAAGLHRVVWPAIGGFPYQERAL